MFCEIEVNFSVVHLFGVVLKLPLVGQEFCHIHLLHLSPVAQKAEKTTTTPELRLCVTDALLTRHPIDATDDRTNSVHTSGYTQAVSLRATY